VKLRAAQSRRRCCLLVSRSSWLSTATHFQQEEADDMIYSLPAAIISRLKRTEALYRLRHQRPSLEAISLGHSQAPPRRDLDITKLKARTRTNIFHHRQKGFLSQSCTNGHFSRSGKTKNSQKQGNIVAQVPTQETGEHATAAAAAAT